MRASRRIIYWVDEVEGHLELVGADSPEDWPMPTTPVMEMTMVDSSTGEPLGRWMHRLGDIEWDDGREE